MTASATDTHTNQTFTAKGLATRERIVDAASMLMLEHGPQAAKLEDIQAVAGVSASQIYHYFTDKSALILAVIGHRTATVLGTHRAALERVDSFDALEEWRNVIVASVEAQNCAGGCPLGSLVSATAETDPNARAALAESFSQWESLLHTGLQAMRDRGELRADTNTEPLALSMLASIQGGLLLSQTHRNTTALSTAIDTTIAYLKTLR